MATSQRSTTRVLNGTPESRTRVKACMRCHQKKKRCDLGLPKCRLCRLAGVECLGYDSIGGRRVARDYVSSLEARVERLESQLGEQDLETRTVRSVGTTSLDSLPSPPTDAVASNRLAAADDELPRPTIQSRLADRTFTTTGRSFDSTILLDELTNFKQGQSSTPDAPSSDLVKGLDTSPVTLPAKQAAIKLVNAYFDSTNLSMPLLHRPTFEKQKLDLVYSLSPTIDLKAPHSTTEYKLAVFFVLQVFAAGILLIQKPEPSKTSTWLADRYHSVAVTALGEAGLPGDVTGVQALLLTAQYSYNHPSLSDSWKIVGAAIRLAVELRLHQEPEMGCLDPLTLDTARRTFWVAYAMDRNISVNLNLPLCLADGGITAKFPSAVEDECITLDGIAPDAPSSQAKCVGLHLFLYRQIQSETRVVLHDKMLPFLPPVDLAAWQLKMRERIEEWYTNSPRSGNQSTLEKRVIETFEVTYNTALFNLYRPTPNIPTPSESQLLSMSKAAMKMIPLYSRFFRLRMLTIYWQAVENVYSAGVALMHAYAQSTALRRILERQSLESLMHTCSSLLWGMVERFPALQTRRDKFDAVASDLLGKIRSDDPGTLRTQGSIAVQTNNFTAEPTFQRDQDIGHDDADESHGAPTDILASLTPSAFVNFDEELSLMLDMNYNGNFTPTWI